MIHLDIWKYRDWSNGEFSLQSLKLLFGHEKSFHELGYKVPISSEKSIAIKI